MRFRKRSTHITISDQEPGLPYSKGLTASQVMVTGLSPYRSYQVAEKIEDHLVARGIDSIATEDLRNLTARVLRDVAGERYAKNFVRWQEVGRLQVPLVILIGGATGVGKSTVATQLAARLGIVRVVPTDAVREVMRGLFSQDLMPTLYTSSFEADAALREPPPPPADKVIVGFREQTAAVAVGVRSLVERAAVEGTSMVIEGAHLVPGFLDVEQFATEVLAVPVVVTVEDEELHRSHFVARSADSAARPMDRYLNGFGNIRKVQKYIKSQALSRGWPVVASYNLDQTIASIIDLVVDRAESWRGGRSAGMPADHVLELEGGKSR
ncbi:MAG TPA: 2-phosphoglycerate kinase [Actinomycetota bacterium]|jgi:2-phosphoglycerate kinase|nr:2-phosphoglycerate kinase [Actinomycetota bacterium]